MSDRAWVLTIAVAFVFGVALMVYGAFELGQRTPPDSPDVEKKLYNRTIMSQQEQIRDLWGAVGDLNDRVKKLEEK